MKTTNRLFQLLGIVLATAGLMACNSGSSGGSGGGSETGELSLAVTDAPVDRATHVVLRFTEVELNRSGGENVFITFDEPQEIDLLTLQGEDSYFLFEDEEIPAGEYTWIRFYVEPNEAQDSPPQSRQVTTSFIEFGDGDFEYLAIPGGQQAGVQTQEGFTIPADGFVALTVDFDLRKMITEGVGPQWEGFHRMRRTGLRIIDNADIGIIEGTLAPEIIPEGQCNAHEEPEGYYACPGAVVYVYEGHGS